MLNMTENIIEQLVAKLPVVKSTVTVDTTLGPDVLLSIKYIKSSARIMFY